MKLGSKYNLIHLHTESPVKLSKIILSIKLLHAHLQYILSAKDWEHPLKASRQVDFTKYHHHNYAEVGKWLSSNPCKFVKIFVNIKHCQYVCNIFGQNENGPCLYREKSLNMMKGNMVSVADCILCRLEEWQDETKEKTLFFCDFIF